MKWLIYVIVFVYMFYRAVYGAKSAERVLTVEPVIYGEEGFLKVGEHKTISCKASNRNQKVEWVYPNGSVVKRIPSNRIFSQEHFVQSLRGRAPALVLTITKAEVHDTGIYTCRSGDLIKEVSLCIIEPSEFVETRTDVAADLGRSITLSCQAKGNPEPRLMWIRNGISITDEDSTAKYRVMTKYNIQGFEGLLTITSLEPEDSGVYSCMSIQDSILAEDCSHSHLLNITLNVNYAPTFEYGNGTKIYAKNNQQVDLICSAPGYPVPTYRWFKELPNDSLLELDKKQIKFNEDTNESILTIVVSSTTFGERFKCQATNDLGTTERYLTLLRIEKPTKIDEIIPQDYTDTIVQLNVTWYDEILFPVSAFQIQYIQDKNTKRGKMYTKDSAWKKSKKIEVKHFDNEQLIETGGTMVTLSNIDAETNYYVRVRALNEAGESPWSNPIQVSTYIEDAEESTMSKTPKDAGAEEKVDSLDSIGNAAFYGIFFAGAVLVLSFVCMFAVRRDK